MDYGFFTIWNGGTFLGNLAENVLREILFGIGRGEDRGAVENCGENGFKKFGNFEFNVSRIGNIWKREKFEFNFFEFFPIRDVRGFIFRGEGVRSTVIQV